MSYFERNHIQQAELAKKSFLPNLEKVEQPKDSLVQRVTGFFKKKYDTLVKKVSTAISSNRIEEKSNKYDYSEFIELPPHVDVEMSRKDFMTEVSSVNDFLKKSGVAYVEPVVSGETDLPTMEDMYEKYYNEAPEAAAGGVMEYRAKTNEQIVDLMKNRLDDQFVREQRNEIFLKRILLEKQFAKDPYIMDETSENPGENINSFQVEHMMEKFSKMHFAEKTLSSQGEAKEQKSDLNTTARPDFDTVAGIRKFIEDARNTFIEDAARPELQQYNKAFEKKLKRIEEKLVSMDDLQRVEDNVYNAAQSLYVTIMGAYNTDSERVLQVIERISESPEAAMTWYAQNKD